MKKLKEFKPLIRLVKNDIKRIIFASIIIFLSGISQIFTGYLNGRIVETITKLEIKQSLIYLAIYFLLELILDGIAIHKANSILYKEESKLTRKLGFETYKKTQTIATAIVTIPIIIVLRFFLFITLVFFIPLIYITQENRYQRDTCLNH